MTRIKYLFNGYPVTDLMIENDRVSFRSNGENYNVSIYTWTNAKMSGLVVKED